MLLICYISYVYIVVKYSFPHLNVSIFIIKIAALIKTHTHIHNNLIIYILPFDKRHRHCIQIPLKINYSQKPFKLISSINHHL